MLKDKHNIKNRFKFLQGSWQIYTNYNRIKSVSQ